MKKIAIIAAGILLAFFVYFGLKSLQFYNNIYTPSSKKQEVKEKTEYNILLFGYGGGNHEGAYLTDSIMFGHVDTKKKKASLFSIPRDMWVKLPTKSGADFHLKVNALYQLELGEMGDVSDVYPDLSQSRFGTEGDAEYTKYIMSQVFGVPIDNYIAVDFEGFTKAIDVLGGVDINVVKTFDDPQYPITGKEKELCGKDEEFRKVETYLNNSTASAEEKDAFFKDKPELEEFFKNIKDEPDKAFPCRYELLHFDKGITHMDGALALKYVRSRHSLQDGSDFGRSARQQHLMQAVKDKVLNIGFVPKIIPLLDEMGKHVKTDFSLGDIKKFASMANDAKQYQIMAYVISDQNLLKDSWSDNGQFILVPKEGIDQWNGLQKAIKNIFNGILPTSTPTISPSVAP